MNAAERAETRQMMKDLLEPIYVSNEYTKEELIKINDHLSKLNSKVATHEKVISENLPHTEAHCSQKETITEIRDNMISTHAVRKTIITAVTITGIVCSIIFVIFQIATKV